MTKGIFTAVAALALCVFAQDAPGARRAITITGARIADGTGGPLRRGNVRIDDGRIAAVGDVDPRPGRARRRPRAWSSPRVHRHPQSLHSGLADGAGGRDPGRAGHHHVVVGADGSSPWPIADYLRERRRKPRRRQRDR